ncbi:hypothetical protein PCC8801_0994 [Rippkaea orientalis PCC 8801]|uniref:PEP-CTERM protein-sorting domain-containing protein n=1 Tax=Rippkaea orientalis (strain PCC 8801 / RF-1) TaxID=41431 RepID=B7K0S9_RIPO1|nr:PEP-CTERM sorting domain-containing protein [Rippkaea orientalis]ACK65070.1 hypothetical protein PCC8801_0994 [Rippkaea orientalis PCC 8801]
MNKTLSTLIGASLVATGVAFLPGVANAASITYDTWTTNEGDTGNYILTITENGSNFDVNLTVNPWNAEALGLFIDLGGKTISNTTLSNVSPTNQVVVFATDTASDNCGQGCNLNGLNYQLASPDGEWEWVFRLGNQGYDGIQTFSFTIANNGATLADFATVGIRAQQLCVPGDTLPNGNCRDSDKSFQSNPTGVVPEPLTILGAGAAIGFGASFKRKLAQSKKQGKKDA